MVIVWKGEEGALVINLAEPPDGWVIVQETPFIQDQPSATCIWLVEDCVDHKQESWWTKDSAASFFIHNILVSF